MDLSGVSTEADDNNRFEILLYFSLFTSFYGEMEKILDGIVLKHHIISSVSQLNEKKKTIFRCTLQVLSFYEVTYPEMTHLWPEVLYFYYLT